MFLKMSEPVKLGDESLDELQIIVQHKKDTVQRAGGISNRQTYVIIKSNKEGLPNNGVLLEGASYCSETEQFCRQNGKLRALKRALENDPNKSVLSVNNRRLLYRTLFPKFEVGKE
jgi:hypothetical protein